MKVYISPFYTSKARNVTGTRRRAVSVLTELPKTIVLVNSIAILELPLDPVRRDETGDAQANADEY